MVIAVKSAPGRRASLPSSVSMAAIRDDGLLWLICQARLVGESEPVIASSYVITPSR